MQINPFASEAAEYAHLRPTYPEKRFELLATIVASRNIGLGLRNGQRPGGDALGETLRASHGDR